ncbi:unnamed protein product [Gongylonema pulchrum]|uniref:Uncharacterized protein n=1 Tax=Gongylonema pulchrum TaxID=637853 RepID=A0A183E3K3_9BILA|nr:unnamed protein product [Gongylonema pulchrum]
MPASCNTFPLKYCEFRSDLSDIIKAVHVPQFYRTTYYPSCERRKLFMTPPVFTKKVDETVDVVAYHTRSRETAAAAPIMPIFVLPKTTRVRKRRVTSPQKRKTKIRQPLPRKAQRRAEQKLSRSGGVRKRRRMKQSLLTSEFFFFH